MVKLKRKYFKLKEKEQKNYLGELELTYKYHDPGHEIKITP
jgi:hypothetical protein